MDGNVQHGLHDLGDKRLVFASSDRPLPFAVTYTVDNVTMTHVGSTDGVDETAIRQELQATRAALQATLDALQELQTSYDRQFARVVALEAAQDGLATRLENASATMRQDTRETRNASTAALQAAKAASASAESAHKAAAGILIPEPDYEPIYQRMDAQDDRAVTARNAYIALAIITLAAAAFLARRPIMNLLNKGKDDGPEDGDKGEAEPSREPEAPDLPDLDELRVKQGQFLEGCDPSPLREAFACK